MRRCEPTNCRQTTEIEALLFRDLLCGTACPLCCECLTVVSRPLGHSWRHCCLYDTLYVDSYIFSLSDSEFAAFLRGSCALQIALIIRRRRNTNNDAECSRENEHLVRTKTSNKLIKVSCVLPPTAAVYKLNKSLTLSNPEVT